MNDLKKERLSELLADQVLFGLNVQENAELQELLAEHSDFKLEDSFELTASAINLNQLNEIEPLPDALRLKILEDSKRYLAAGLQSQDFKTTENLAESEIQKTFAFEPKRPFFNWLGWAVAGVACVALAFSLWTNLQKPKVIEIVKEVPPRVLTAAEEFAQLETNAKDVRRTNWVNPKNEQEVLGEVVWSESWQKGFMKFKNLAANNKYQETYQLWIFDETQSEKTPIDGGVFDISSSGETIIPIDAKLKFKNPKLFAVTVEKPGGVVVSNREKIVAVGKV